MGSITTYRARWFDWFAFIESDYCKSSWSLICAKSDPSSERVKWRLVFRFLLITSISKQFLNRVDSKEEPSKISYVYYYRRRWVSSRTFLRLPSICWGYKSSCLEPWPPSLRLIARTVSVRNDKYALSSIRMLSRLSDHNSYPFRCSFAKKHFPEMVSMQTFCLFFCWSAHISTFSQTNIKCY